MRVRRRNWNRTMWRVLSIYRSIVTWSPFYRSSMIYWRKSIIDIFRSPIHLTHSPHPFISSMHLFIISYPKRPNTAFSSLWAGKGLPSHAAASSKRMRSMMSCGCVEMWRCYDERNQMRWVMGGVVWVMLCGSCCVGHVVWVMLCGWCCVGDDGWIGKALGWWYGGMLDIEKVIDIECYVIDSDTRHSFVIMVLNIHNNGTKHSFVIIIILDMHSFVYLIVVGSWSGIHKLMIFEMLFGRFMQGC